MLCPLFSPLFVVSVSSSLFSPSLLDFNTIEKVCRPRNASFLDLPLPKTIFIHYHATHTVDPGLIKEPHRWIREWRETPSMRCNAIIVDLWFLFCMEIVQKTVKMSIELCDEDVQIELASLCFSFTWLWIKNRLPFVRFLI